MRKASLTKNHKWFEEDVDWYIKFLGRMLGAKREIQRAFLIILLYSFMSIVIA